jgi:hypothetical protein
LKYKNQNSVNYIDENDYKATGYSIVPEITLGLQLGASYKGFDLEMFFQGAMNRSVYWDGYYFHAFQDNGKISAVALDRWAFYTDPQTGEQIDTRATASYPRLSYNDNPNNYHASSFWLKNGNFLKLRSLELGYTIPKQMAEKLKTRSIRVFLNGTNLFSLDHMKGYMDPEAAFRTIDYQPGKGYVDAESVSAGIYYPVLRTFSVGLSIQL